MVSTYEYAFLSNEVYKNDGGIMPSTDWQVLVTSGNGNDTEGYFGAAYINNVTHEIVIAHRGTDDLNDADDDLMQLAVGNVPDQFSSATTFIQVVKAFRAIDPNTANYNITYTGHSLGAALAELSSAIDNTKAVTFDSPGSAPVILAALTSGMISTPDGFTKEEYIDQLDVTSYQAGADLVNTLNTHVGDLIRVYPNYYVNTDPDTFGVLLDNYYEYSRPPLGQHSMDGILDSVVTRFAPREQCI